MGRVRIGTCSWTDPTLLKSGWYPPGAKTAETRLQFYSSNFDIVEVDSTYYSLLPERTAGLWTQRTPDGFTFNVKAFSLFTQHPTPVKALPKEIRALVPAEHARPTVYQKDLPEQAVKELWQFFARALLPLDSAGKLGVVLFQFPQWFFPGKDSLEYIASCKENLPQYRIAVEFRNGAWLSDRNKDITMAFLRDNGLIYVSVDEPQGFRSSAPPIAEVTSDMAVVRFHGRNRETWEQKGISVAERFAYHYSREELQEWMPRVQAAAAVTREVHVLFNNCYGDYAVRNARDLQDMVRDMQPGLFTEQLQEEGS
ncbi:MAG: DUF72 domain-containing protein [Chloroflexi bacterium]|nr:DUF72 domain-containing protein [Chloroflexota bacterium]